jgi:BlaI family penicillinase repressor
MGRRPDNTQITPLELQILQVLWKMGTATVQQVQDQLLPEQKLAYTTVQTMLTVLYRKGRVKRTLKGKAYEYEAALSQKSATSMALRDVLSRFFSGSPENLVMNLIETQQLSPEKLEKLTRLVSAEEEDKERK